MEKVLVTGVAGQLGYDVVRRLGELKIEAVGVDIEDFDLTNAQETADYIKKCEPTVIVHCAAYTAVDKAEDFGETAYAVNVAGTENIAQAAAELNCKFVYISTDYVFDGDTRDAHNANSPKKPEGVYARTKYQGEIVCEKLLSKLFIVRLSWVFGINGGNFVKTMIKLGKERDELGVVCDQIGSPTYTVDAAKLICEMIETEKYGVYNVANEGYCSWYEFAKGIFEQAGLNVKVNSLTSDQYPTRAKRPKNSCFSKKELDENGFERLPSWENALERFIKELEN